MKYSPATFTCDSDDKYYMEEALDVMARMAATGDHEAQALAEKALEYMIRAIHAYDETTDVCFDSKTGRAYIDFVER